MIASAHHPKEDAVTVEHVATFRRA